MNSAILATKKRHRLSNLEKMETDFFEQVEDLHDVWLVLRAMKEEEKNQSESMELHEFLKQLDED